MQYIEAISAEKAEYKSVFFAGGISNCPDWQKGLVDTLKDYEITVYNPRRNNFPIDDDSESEAQIIWEFDRLKRKFREKTTKKLHKTQLMNRLPRFSQKICSYELNI